MVVQHVGHFTRARHLPDTCTEKWKYILRFSAIVDLIIIILAMVTDERKRKVLCDRIVSPTCCIKCIMVVIAEDMMAAFNAFEYQ